MMAKIRVRAVAIPASVWKGVVVVAELCVDAHYWLGRVCHVGELDVVFSFVQVLHK
jgi:hypothetical protein